MRTILLATLALLAVHNPGIAQKVSSEQAVREAFGAFSQAYAAADIEVLEDLLVEHYIHINGRSGSVIDKRGWLDYVVTRRVALDNGTLLIETYDVADVIVRVHGEVAVLTGVVESTGRRDGEPFHNRIRFTNVWVDEGGVWRRAAFHDSPIPPESAR